MKNLATSVFILFFLSAFSAQVFGNVAVTGDAEAGKSKAAVCAGCHGGDGNSMIANFPKLAGQNSRYLFKQLQDMKSGERVVPEMAAFLPGLSDEDMADIATYYASQKSTVAGAKKELAELGAKVYRSGNKETGVTACAACHGAQGNGMAEAGFPKISGQHAAYIEAQLKAFRAAGRGDHEGKKRANDGETKMMRAVAGKLSDDEIKAVSSFISGLH